MSNDRLMSSTSSACGGIFFGGIAFCLGLLYNGEKEEMSVSVSLRILLLVVTQTTFTSRSVLRTKLKAHNVQKTKTVVQTVAILVVCAFLLNTKEAHAFLLTKTTCTYEADSTKLKDIPSLPLPRLA